MAMEQHPDGRPMDPDFSGRLKTSIADVAKAQVDTGVDVINDGEFGKLSWNTYINGRLAGHEIVPFSRFSPRLRTSRDRQDFAAFYAQLERNDSH
jgi:5-methyltetrahydropteroyltriglutamate--homocysteine methyltransferase